MNGSNKTTDTAPDISVNPNGRPLSFKFKVWTTLLFVFLSFALSSVPFLIAEFKTPPGQQFLGQVNNYPDYNQYFSYIHQSYEGKWLFDNRVTYLPSRPILLNLEWLGLGKLMRIFHLSENVLIQVWRFLGAASLIGGFAFLAANFPLSRKRWMVALGVFSLGGGFGSLVSLAVAAHLAPASAVHSLAIDMWGNLHPFQVIMGNPHAALATGVELFGFGCFLISERRQSLWYSCLAGLIIFISGFMRPYDLISFGLILLIFNLVETALHGFSVRQTVRRWLPGVIVLPTLAYNFWVFTFDPVFKYWAIQNNNASYLPHFYVYYLAFGLAGLLALNRVWQFKRQPFILEERFLLVWFVPLFTLMYMGTLIPALSGSPSIGYTLLTPLLLLGVLTRRFDNFGPDWKWKLRPSWIIAVVTCWIVFTSVCTVGFYSLKFFSGKTFQASHRLEVYADRREIEAWRWIDGHLPPDKMIMATSAPCNLMARLTSLHKVTGHWSMTPHYYELGDRLSRFYSSHELGTNELNLLKEFKADYIYFGPDERRDGSSDLEKYFATGLVFQNELVSIYEISHSQIKK